MFDGKSLADFTNLFSLNNFKEKNLKLFCKVKLQNKNVETFTKEAKQNLVIGKQVK